MLNKIWPIFIIISIIYAVFTGNVEQINNSIFDSCKQAIDLSITLLRNNVPMEWNYANCRKNKLYKQDNKIVITIYEIFISRY